MTPTLIEDSLTELAGLGLIRLYGQKGTRYADFPSWTDHQRINRPTPSKLPPYNESLNTHGVLTEDSSRKGKEGKGRQEKREREGGKGKWKEGKVKGRWER